MARSDVTEGEGSAEEAINRVLDAERRAQDGVARCEARAAAVLAAARERALRIQARTDRRVSALRARCTQLIDARVAERRASAEAVRSRPPGGDDRQTLLAEAVTRLAAQLTDGDV